jgi:uncharacterized protein (TIGR02246 family)
MPLNLQHPVATFFESNNAHDADALANLFAADARVHDENADHRGRDAIREWAEETFRKYGTVLTPREAREEGDATVVTTGVAGTFPGSPIELRFRFVTDDEAIQELEIG